MDKQKKILIIEDDEILLRTIADKFSNNFDVLQANNGAEGLRVALNEHPDLILLDNFMPIMSGIEVMEHLRKDPWGQKVPIIILTSYDTTDATLEKVAKYTPSFYLVKDRTSLGEIEQKVRQQLGM